MGTDGPRTARRRPRRGSLERPLEWRLVRAALVVVVPPLALLLFTVARPGVLAAPALPPSFDGPTATLLAQELATVDPVRVPGGPGSAGAASWYAEKLQLYGIDVETDAWREEVPSLGDVELRNVAGVVEGRTPEVIVVAAHRDTAPGGPGANDNASGTAALVELARSYAAPSTGGQRARPLHTLVFLSTDGGAYGGVGAARFAATSRFRDRVLAVVVLDAIGGEAPRLELTGDAPRSPAPALVRTAAVRVREHAGAEPALPPLAQQLVDLALPFGYGDQAPFLGSSVSGIRLTTADEAGGDPAADQPETLDAVAVTRLGQSAQSLLGSLDAAIDLAQGTPPALFTGDRAVRGWAVQLVLIALVVPFLVGVADLLARCRRRGARLGPAARALSVRLAAWLWVGLVVAIAGLAGLLPSGPARPLPPHGEAAVWPLGALLVIGVLGAAGFVVAGRRLRGAGRANPEDELAAHAASLVALFLVTVVVILDNAFALLFVVPSLYAWLFLAQATRPWARALLFAAGLLGPVVGLAVLAARFELGVAVLPYALSLASTGYLSTLTVVSFLAWCAVASQLAVVSLRRYAPLPRRSGRVLGAAAASPPQLRRR